MGNIDIIEEVRDEHRSRNSLADHGYRPGNFSIKGYEFSKPVKVFALDQWFDVATWSEVKEAVYNRITASGRRIPLMGRMGLAELPDGFRRPRRLENGEFIDVGFDSNTLVRHCCLALRLNGLEPLDHLKLVLYDAAAEAPEIFAPEVGPVPESDPLERLVAKLREFVHERDWEQFHNPKDLALAISIESGELLEHFLWKDADQVTRQQVAHEMADVLIYCLMLADKLGIDLYAAIQSKIGENALKYPVEKSKGKMTKWDKL
jgi:NTP pyrophosphatase (non-canonical NTP hydrolase)